jgi:hypothetical protein
VQTAFLVEDPLLTEGPLASAYLMAVAEKASAAAKLGVQPHEAVSVLIALC